MAKKILYKVSAFHCPRCGGIAEPTKKYCEFCERELLLQKYSGEKPVMRSRILIDCGEDYVNFNEVRSIEVNTAPNTIEASRLEDSYVHTIRGVSTSSEIEFSMPYTRRGFELQRGIDRGKVHKIRVESVCGNYDYAFEADGYISEYNCGIPNANSVMMINYSIVADNMTTYDSSIPKEVWDELTCPNCGAPLKSIYCACDYCGGWSEFLW